MRYTDGMTPEEINFFLRAIPNTKYFYEGD